MPSRQLTLYHVDAFSARAFSGNPAAVCPLEAWLPTELMQAIAAENNLSETAFFVPSGDGYELRWFTPAIEVDLCGHATLAAAYVIFNYLAPERTALRFGSLSGALTVRRDGDLIVLDFPARPAAPCDPPPGIAAALGAAPAEALAAANYLLVYPSEADIIQLKPDFARLSQLERSVIVTAPGTATDFVSRYFAPLKGVPEDPVTGSAHCTLIPYWSKRLAKSSLTARQLSRRGGDLYCKDCGPRVEIAGRATLYLQGQISI